MIRVLFISFYFILRLVEYYNLKFMYSLLGFRVALLVILESYEMYCILFFKISSFVFFVFVFFE